MDDAKELAEELAALDDHRLCKVEIERLKAEIARLNEAVAYAARLDNAQEDEIARLKKELEAARAEIKDWEDNTYGKNDIAWTTAQKKIAQLRQQAEQAAERQRELADLVDSLNGYVDHSSDLQVYGRAMSDQIIIFQCEMVPEHRMEI